MACVPLGSAGNPMKVAMGRWLLRVDQHFIYISQRSCCAPYILLPIQFVALAFIITCFDSMAWVVIFLRVDIRNPIGVAVVRWLFRD